MKYILLDTNIIIDMVIDRRNQVSDSVLRSFIKLLDYKEIMLIVPDIVKYETEKHLVNELKYVEKRISDAEKSIKGLYGINTYSACGLDLKEIKTEAIAKLKDAHDKFKLNESEYKTELISTINLVFSHENSIVIPFDDFLCKAVIARKIYKRAPLHKEEKDSYADALIAEILINLNRYVEFGENDTIYFVTGNFKDFCVDKNKKEVLLPDIYDDLKKNYSNDVCCVNSFADLINKKLKGNIETADLSEEFSACFKILQDVEYRDSERETLDLIPLSSFNNYVEYDFRNSNLYTYILDKFNVLNEIYWLPDQELIALCEDLLEQMNNVKLVNVFNFIKHFEKVTNLSGEMPDVNTKEYTINDFQKIKDWLNLKLEVLERIDSIEKLPDKINFGDTIEFINSDFQVLKISLEEMPFSFIENNEESIEMKICIDKDVLAKGCIKVLCGYMNFDEDGGIDEGITDSIDYEFEEIEELIEGIIESWRVFIDNISKQLHDIEKFFNEIQIADTSSL